MDLVLWTTVAGNVTKWWRHAMYSLAAQEQLLRCFRMVGWASRSMLRMLLQRLEST